MNYKRLEIYLGWTCNFKCVFCIEHEKIEKNWNKIVSESEILKKLIKYKKLGYNHVTYLGGEPFIQRNFLFALKVGKKLGYKILVTTNGSMLQFENIAKKYLPFIDELIISIPIIDKNLQPIINNTKVIVDFDKVFLNIKKFFKGNFLKVNVVLNNYNLKYLNGIVEFLAKYKVKELAFTYPDISNEEFSKEYILKKVAMMYSNAIKYVISAFELGQKYGITVKIVDFPFCVFPDEKYIKFSDDYNYSGRLKIDDDGEEMHRNKDLIKNKKEYFKYIPRSRKKVGKCFGCKYYNICWGIQELYEELFGLDEIKLFKLK